MQDKYVESYAMKEVFNMESSVRVQAIENLGKVEIAHNGWIIAYIIFGGMQLLIQDKLAWMIIYVTRMPLDVIIYPCPILRKIYC